MAEYYQFLNPEGWCSLLLPVPIMRVSGPNRTACRPGTLGSGRGTDSSFRYDEGLPLSCGNNVWKIGRHLYPAPVERCSRQSGGRRKIPSRHYSKAKNPRKRIIFFRRGFVNPWEVVRNIILRSSRLACLGLLRFPECCDPTTISIAQLCWVTVMHGIWEWYATPIH